MKRQRGMALLISLVLSLLLGLLAASALREAIQQARLAGQLLASARALEQAEATLIDGAALLTLTPPAPCQACMPPADPHDLAGGQGTWQNLASGYALLQNLGQSNRAAQMPEGEPVTLYRVTAVSQQTAARHVLEAVYALPSDPDQALQRVLWRQRLREP